MTRAEREDMVVISMGIAEGLREAARQCKERQAALHARLTGGAQTIERLCRAREQWA